MGLKSLSKFLSYVLRHHPEVIDLEIDENGWAEIAELIEKAGNQKKSLDRQTIEKLIEEGNKQRFMLSDDGKFIRAGYGHSIDVDLKMAPQTPPEDLYHGTARANVGSILKKGIHPGNRNFVHLSSTKAEAKNVGGRHGKPVVLIIKSLEMSREGHLLFQSESEPTIWLTKNVPAKYVIEES